MNIRRVETNLTLGLESRSLKLYEGVDETSLRHIEVAHARADHEDSLAVETARLAVEGLHRREDAVYILGERAIVKAIASFTAMDEKMRCLDYKMYSQDIDELAFLLAMHKDLRDDIRPYYRRYSGAVWTRVALNSMRQSVLAEAGYELNGMAGRDAVMLRP
jgi:hypothetical protein